MKLITEINEHIVTESKVENGGKSYYIQGVFLQANLENRNGRIYPMDILEKEVARYHHAYISQRRALGELNHADSPSIGLDRVSHLITELYKEGNNFIGKAKILDTPNGRIVKALIDDGVKLGVSSRGMGTLKENSRGIQEVQSDFTLSTAADVVSDPSAPAAFVRGVMEGKEWVFVDGLLTEQTVEKIKKRIKKASRNQIEEAVLISFEELMRLL